jgi:hypothetical protein
VFRMARQAAERRSVQHFEQLELEVATRYQHRWIVAAVHAGPEC